MRTIEEMAEVAASWWADKIINPTFDAGSKYDADVMLHAAECMASFRAACNKPSDNARESFKKILKAKIIEKLVKFNVFSISCDYEPEGILRESLNESGISTSNVPWKTAMLFNTRYGSVEVKCGYGASLETL